MLASRMSDRLKAHTTIYVQLLATRIFCYLCLYSRFVSLIFIKLRSPRSISTRKRCLLHNLQSCFHKLLRTSISILMTIEEFSKCRKQRKVQAQHVSYAIIAAIEIATYSCAELKFIWSNSAVVSVESMLLKGVLTSEVVVEKARGEDKRRLFCTLGYIFQNYSCDRSNGKVPVHPIIITKQTRLSYGHISCRNNIRQNDVHINPTLKKRAQP